MTTEQSDDHHGSTVTAVVNTISHPFPPVPVPQDVVIVLQHSEEKLRPANEQQQQQQQTPVSTKTPTVSSLPIRMIATVVRGYGRGSKDLGIPTANLDCHTMQSSTPFHDLPTGIYWGYARIVHSNRSSSSSSSGNNDTNTSTNDDDNSTSNVTNVDTTNIDSIYYKAAISIGYNPTYGNTTKTVEPHFIVPRNDPRRYASISNETILHDFYNDTCRLSVVGYIRPELPFTGLDALVHAIKNDIVETERCTELNDPISLNETVWVQSDAPLQ